MKKIIFLFGILSLLGTGIFFQKNQDPPTQSEKVSTLGDPHPLQITEMRKKSYPGSEITIEEELEPGSNYRQYLASYQSGGLKINASLTVPEGHPPVGGWPAIIFNHGYIPPAQYTTTGRYVTYTDAFSGNGYVVLKPDYRGHGTSEGNPEGGYYSTAYTVDVLNAVSSIKKLRDPSTGSGRFVVDTNRIGMWGHSMGGSLTLRSMVVSKDIKAGIIWAGVVASYEDMIKNWGRSRPFMLSEREQAFRRPGRQALIDKYGDPDQNPGFWKSISPIAFVKDISGPLQLHHGTGDEEVPVLFSERLNEAMKEAGNEVEFFTYEGDDHNISGNLNVALNRSVEFFNKYLK